MANTSTVIKIKKERIVKPKNGIVQPAVLPPPDRPGRKTNQLKFIFKVVNEILKLKLSEPFREPVDAKQFPDYHKFIKQPMDLGTIKNRLENQYYWSSQEAIKDFETIFVNCILYNKRDDHPLIKTANKLKKIFDDKIGKMPKDEVELDESPKRKARLNKTITQKADLNETQKKKKVSFYPHVVYIAKVEHEPKEKKSKKSRKTIVATSPIPNTPEEPKELRTIEGRLQTPAKNPAKRRRSKTVAAEEPQQQVTEHLRDASPTAGTVIDNSTEPSTEPVVNVVKERRKIVAQKKSRRLLAAMLAKSSEPAASSETVANRNVENANEMPNTELASVEQETNAEALPTSDTEIRTDSNRQQNLIQSDRLSDAETTNVSQVSQQQTTKTQTTKTSVQSQVQSQVQTTESSDQTQQIEQSTQNTQNTAKDSGVSSNPEDVQIQLKLLQTQVTMMVSQLESITQLMNNQRMTDFVSAYSNATSPPSKRARIDTILKCKEEILVDSSVIDTSRIDDSPSQIDEELSSSVAEFSKVILNLPPEKLSKVLEGAAQYDPSLQDSDSRMIQLDLRNRTTVDLLQSLIKST